VLRKLIDLNKRASRRLDGALAPKYRVDGNREFVEQIVPAHLRAGQRIYDVGAGRSPCLSLQQKAALSLQVIGLDIDRESLDAAPAGAYDSTICADVCTYRGRSDGDLIICQALLEHVPDVAQAFAAIASILKPGGRALIFVPSRNAAFARLNLVLPHSLKRLLLFAVYPDARRGQGFVSFYNRCTPADFDRLAADNGLRVEERHLYWSSQYFTFALPLHALWRGGQRLYEGLAGDQAAETFTMVLQKQ
jgi:SAM-dependent methyltransferase